MTLEEYSKSWKKLADGLKDVLVSQLHGETDLTEDFVREQLYSGVNGDEESLTPKYSQDPYFKTAYGKNWKPHAIGYMKWKRKIQPPAPSYLGFRPRSMDTPNLIIRGDFYSSITAIPVKDGIMITSQGVSFSADIEAKYTPRIYKISNKAKKHYITYYAMPQIKDFIKSCGL
jgi:hypothetical protein